MTLRGRAPAAAILVLVLLAGALPASAALRIKGDAAYAKGVRAALKRISKTKTGARLLKELEKTGRTVSLRAGGQDNRVAMTYPTGEGDSVVLWDPGRELPGMPPFLILYHELVHALHLALSGQLPGSAEEDRAIGQGDFAGYELSENALRRELGLPPRAPERL